MTNGDIIYLLRRKAKMTQIEFGKFNFNIPRRTIQNWEGGINQCPDYVRDPIVFHMKAENKVENFEINA